MELTASSISFSEEFVSKTELNSEVLLAFLNVSLEEHIMLKSGARNTNTLVVDPVKNM